MCYVGCFEDCAREKCKEKTPTYFHCLTVWQWESTHALQENQLCREKNWTKMNAPMFVYKMLSWHKRKSTKANLPTSKSDKSEMVLHFFCKLYLKHIHCCIGTLDVKISGVFNGATLPQSAWGVQGSQWLWWVTVGLICWKHMKVSVDVGPWGVVVVGTKDGWLACFFVLGQTFCNKVKSSVKFLCCFLFKVIQR